MLLLKENKTLWKKKRISCYYLQLYSTNFISLIFILMITFYYQSRFITKGFISRAISRGGAKKIVWEGHILI